LTFLEASPSLTICLVLTFPQGPLHKPLTLLPVPPHTHTHMWSLSDGFIHLLGTLKKEVTAIHLCDKYICLFLQD
jgi:hypothetical protein